MSDVEEPAAKILKIENNSQGTEEELDEGQEEWLSEDVLTDDDGQTMQEERLDDTLASLDSAPSSVDATHEQTNRHNIEQELDHMENSNQSNMQDLEAFLDKKSAQELQESDLDESSKHSDDDGHDTDELLRMLGEDDQSGKIKVTKKKAEQKKPDTSDDEDEEHLFHGANIRQLKVAKSVLRKEMIPTKAEPEDMSDGDADSFMSSDEAATVKKMFAMRHPGLAAKTTGKSGVIRPTITVTKKVVTVDRSGDKAELKSIKQEEPQVHVKTEDLESFQEEFLDEEFDEEGVLEAMKEGRQDIMRPEEMDEEIPSDCESNSDDDSLYDDFPSSDSEDMDEWFTLDIREERAGEYLSLLGQKAHKLLTEEKERVSLRLESLKENISALSRSGKQQAEQLRKATAALAELDATLKAS